MLWIYPPKFQSMHVYSNNTDRSFCIYRREREYTGCDLRSFFLATRNGPRKSRGIRVVSRTRLNLWYKSKMSFNLFYTHIIGQNLGHFTYKDYKSSRCNAYNENYSDALLSNFAPRCQIHWFSFCVMIIIAILCIWY